MYKQIILLQGLLSASLFTFISHTHAQESVSSFEQSLAKKNETIKSTQAETKPGKLSSHYNLHELAKELKTRGWDTQNEADGSLILTPIKSSDNLSHKKEETNASTSSQWQQLQQKLQQAGWSVSNDSDGAMRLTPPSTYAAAKAEENSNTVNNNAQNSFMDMQQKLKASGWDITNNSDGSILLYPPESTPQKKVAADRLQICPGTRQAVEITLPVDSWQEAHNIANEWLKNTSIPYSAVGKIRRINKVYIISIVADKAPYALMHQIAIRNSNGAVIVLN
ncbi:MAG: hypothetical protein KZQ83_04850 [gamma proteobacterium symbiont of Taylorina sp.]|nr:hypothetical protein [gamma proteobacterium symbiont of Taylorina sp.]